MWVECFVLETAVIDNTNTFTSKGEEGKKYELEFSLTESRVTTTTYLR